jgi:hypothetical protein
MRLKKFGQSIKPSEDNDIKFPIRVMPGLCDPFDPVNGVDPAIPRVGPAIQGTTGVVFIQNEGISDYNGYRQQLLNGFYRNRFRESLNHSSQAMKDTPMWFLEYCQTVESLVKGDKAGLDKAIQKHNKEHPEGPVDDEYQAFSHFF